MSLVVDADAHPQRMAPDLADGHQSTFAAGAFVLLEGCFALGLHVARELGAAEILAQLVALEALPPLERTTPSLPIMEIDAGRSEIDLVVECREVHGIERRDHDAADAAVALQEAPCELHRPLAAGAADDRLADMKSGPRCS